MCSIFASKLPIIPHLFRMSVTTANAISPKRLRTEGAPLTIGTHSGTFHCDEVLACFMLKQLPEYENAKILRSRNDAELHEHCDIIVDVGGEFDHEKKLYDHHQKTFQETMSSLRPELGDQYKIRLSSAGLVFCFYGERVIDQILKKHANVSLSPENLKLTFKQLYANFISELDAIDNGVQICPDGKEPLYKISTHLSKRVGNFNPGWEEEGTNVDVNARFEEAMAYAGKEFIDNVLSIGGSWIKAREYVRTALKTAKDVYESGEILMLEKFCPWKHHLSALEKEFEMEGVPKLVIFVDTSGGWRVAGVPVTPDSFLGRKFLPEPWRGLRDEELSKMAGIEGLTFVHHTGFIGGAKTKEAAVAMAIKSVQWSS
ncbi:MYG1 protein isoform X2 [Lucilia sericata]|uniref:MYG1 protein isoform X2 n=1 Tax=Lucilia sericata TaxID=13632 RepID=UPI0018A84994|nr:MYG1 protein isoform X2 [Lucilia sericata]